MPPKAYRYRSEADLERALFRWFERYQSLRAARRTDTDREVTVLLSVDELRNKARSLARRLCVPREVVTRRWVKRWQSRYGLPTPGGVTPLAPTDVTEQLPVVKREQISPSQLSDSQVYCGFVFQLDWRSLPDRSLEQGGRVWVLGASDRTGRHRTRLLVAGQLWRPPCLQGVNMLSQPVVYAGGGNGTITPDLFSWWLQGEFIPAASHLHPNGVVLVMEKSAFLPSDTDFTSLDGKVVVKVLPEATLDWPVVVAELKTRYAISLLSAVNRDVSVADILAQHSLKEAFPLLHRAWLNVRSETFSRCWSAPCLEPPLLCLTSRGAASPIQLQEDRALLLELQWLSHDLGLEVADEDLSQWARGGGTPVSLKTEPVEDGEWEVPSPLEVVDHLTQALRWMETEPLDPGLLMLVRDIISLAKQASKMGLAPTHPGAALPFFCHNGDHLSQPPPAHMGIPPYQLDPKGAGAMAGLTRPPMYPFTTGQYPYPMLSPEMSQVAASWHTPSMYPISTGGGFRTSYPTSLPITSTTLPSDFYRFSPTGLIPPHGLSPHGHHPSHPHSLASHPAIVTPGPKQELGAHPLDHNHRSSSMDQKNSTSSTTEGSKNQDSGQTGNNQDKKKPHIKKPLNAFMLYMKEMRAKVVAECTLKESAAINQILGRRWHALGREEQAKYYELARRERQLHMQLYPDWSSRANSSRGKKRKRKQETNDGGNSMKKCRARYGLDQQNQWCKPCSPDHGPPPGLGVHASLVHSTSNAASPQEPTYVNL